MNVRIAVAASLLAAATSAAGCKPSSREPAACPNASGVPPQGRIYRQDAVPRGLSCEPDAVCDITVHDCPDDWPWNGLGDISVYECACAGDGRWSCVDKAPGRSLCSNGPDASGAPCTNRCVGALACGYDVTGGCGAEGVCVQGCFAGLCPNPPPTHAACGCDGRNAAYVSTGYSNVPVSSANACDGGVGDGGATDCPAACVRQPLHAGVCGFAAPFLCVCPSEANVPMPQNCSGASGERTDAGTAVDVYCCE